MSKEKDYEALEERIKKYSLRYPKDLNLAGLRERLEDREFEEMEKELGQLVTVRKLETSGEASIPIKERRKFTSGLSKKIEDY
ncbi:hypothetical protein ACFLRC_01235 [Candidatus Altiarchaeota archaeon]